jgi:hypothetical protein
MIMWEILVWEAAIMVVMQMEVGRLLPMYMITQHFL